jgi:predicted dehydrogenase
MKVKKILIVGFGSIGKRHFSNLKFLFPNREIIILRSKKNSNKINGAKQVFTYDEALSLRPQVAFICNPSSFHFESAKKLIKHNIHLFFEKPLSNSLENLDDNLIMINKQKIKATVGYNLRYNDSLIRAKEILKSERYGKILCSSIEVGQYLPNWRPKNDYKATVSSQKLLGGGALLELSHELDYLHWLFGKPYSVSATVQKVSQLDIDVEDLVLADFEIFSDNRSFPCRVHLDFLQHKKSRNCKIIFEDAVLYLDLITNSINVYQNEENILNYQGQLDNNQTYLNEIKVFMDCIQNDKIVPVSLEDGAKTLKLINDIQNSSKLRKRVLCE